MPIPNSEYERSLNPWVGGVGLPADLRRDMIQVLTGLGDEPFLLIVPGHPTGFSEITDSSHAPERAAMKRIEGLFPVPPPSSTTSLYTNQPSVSK